LPESNPIRKLDQTKLRELRKKLDGHLSSKEFDTYFNEIINEAVDLCTGWFVRLAIVSLVAQYSFVF
jgi:hypothetical protein